MSYNIKIGNAKPYFEKDEDELYATWEVEDQSLENAPNFPNDPTGTSNERSPAYSVWRDFADWCGLYDLLLGMDGLMYNHPGCKPLKKEHYEQIKAVLEKKKGIVVGEPGFQKLAEEEGSMDEYGIDQSHLARLIWLEFWVNWALENCETPAIWNN